MKIRLDFVTNSSSTGFVVGVKGDLTKEKVLSALGINNTSPLFELANDIAQFIVDNASPYSVEEDLADYGWETVEDLPDGPYWGSLKTILRRGWAVFQGAASLSEGDRIETIVGNFNLCHDGDEIYIETGRM